MLKKITKKRHILGMYSVEQHLSDYAKTYLLHCNIRTRMAPTFPNATSGSAQYDKGKVKNQNNECMCVRCFLVP